MHVSIQASAVLHQVFSHVARGGREREGMKCVVLKQHLCAAQVEMMSDSSLAIETER